MLAMVPYKPEGLRDKSFFLAFRYATILLLLTHNSTIKSSESNLSLVCSLSFYGLIQSHLLETKHDVYS